MVSILDTQLGRYRSAALGIFRIAIGLLWALHGTSKLFGWPPGKSGAVPFGTWPNWWAGVIELVAGILVMLGVFTRIAALVGAATMAYAYFTVHQPTGLLPIQNGGEPAVLFGIAFVLIGFTGAGAFALGDRHRQ